ncbi:MAG: hypothetical protein AAB257_04020 [Nitrospinota bacterium]|jgi:hypothetical protein
MKIKFDNLMKKGSPISVEQSDSSDRVEKKDIKGFEKFLSETKKEGKRQQIAESEHHRETTHSLLKNKESAEWQALRKNAVNSLERLLATLDIYRNALNNEKIDFDRMYTIIEDMNREKDKMLATMIELPDGDNLKAIMTSAAISVLNETNKYYKNYMY